MELKDTDSRRPHKEINLGANAAANLAGNIKVQKKEVKLNTAKEESMADKQFTTENPLWNYAGQAQEAMKEIYGYQVKTTHALVDQMMKWGQTYTDHLYTQVNEATRLSQEVLKSGAHLTEEMKKNHYSMTEKMTK